MKPALLFALALTAALASTLAACTEEKKASAARTAEGEILAGSISDAMLPLDTVRSQAPLAPKAAEPGDPKSASPAKVDPPKEAEPSEPVADAPAE